VWSAVVLAQEYSRPWQQGAISTLAAGVSLTSVLGSTTLSFRRPAWVCCGLAHLDIMFNAHIIGTLRISRTDRVRSRVFMAALLVIAALPTRAMAQDNLSVKDAIQQALRSPAAQVVQARVDEVRGNLRQAGLGPNPRLFLQSEDLRPWADNFSFKDQTEDYGYLSQIFELDGKRGKRVALGNARLKQAEAERDLRLRQIAGAVSSAYWNAVSLQRVSDLLTDDSKAVDDMVRYHKERVDNGAMKGVDLLRMQIERDRLEISLQTAKRDATQAKLELFRQMGVAATGQALSGRLEDLPRPAAVNLQDALQHRPEIAAAQDAVQAAEADLKLQRANGVPDPDILGGYKRNSGANTIFTSLQIPLPFRNRNQGEVERARASVTAAQASLAVVEAQIRNQVMQAQAAYNSQEQIVNQTLPDMRARAQQNLDIISEAYRIGGVDLLRFIDAERTKFDVEVIAARALAQLQQSALQLQIAYGVQP
jgi:cobalt-zinc-cadmium efflux system outer membrane protein